MPFSAILLALRNSHGLHCFLSTSLKNLQTRKSIDLQTVHIFIDCL